MKTILSQCQGLCLPVISGCMLQLGDATGELVNLRQFDSLLRPKL